MAYIGNNVQVQGFTPAIDYFNGNGSAVTFTLSRPIASVAQVIVAIDNVVQNSSTAYSVSGNSITFTSAPLSGSNNIWVQYTSPITTYAAISQDPSVIGDITATGGFLSTGDFGNTYTDGTVVDYVTGMARITTGPVDGLTIYNGGTSARTALMSITSAGNVGIGATPPTLYATSTKGLQLNGSSMLIDYSGSGSRQTILVNNAYLNASGAYTYLNTDPATVYNQINGVHAWYSAPSGTSGTTATFTERMRLTTGGNVVLAGGTTSANGVGITFPATQSASTDVNCLDDYEEGTWTPIDASGAGLTFSVASAYYIKIGKLVFANTYLGYPSTANASPAVIGGLPFTAYAGDNYSYLYGRNNSGSNIVWQVTSASTTMVGNNPAAAGSPTNASLSTSYILISGSYIAAN